MRAHLRHALSMFAAVAMLCGLTFVGASPAQAVVGVDLNTSDATIALGDSFDLSWTSTDAITLVATNHWSGNKAVPNGTESITPSSASTYTYTLTATDENGREASDTVTVDVINGPITPAPVLFTGCDVIVPATPNVTYFVDYGDEDIEELEADTYPAGYFDIGGPVLFYAEAADGFSFADDAVTEWEYTTPDDCGLVTVTATCDEVTFTNISDLDVFVQWGDFDASGPEGQFDLDPGATRTIQTDRDNVDFYASTGDDGEDGLQEGSIELPTDCDEDPADGSDHPTVAPAAGK